MTFSVCAVVTEIPPFQISGSAEIGFSIVWSLLKWILVKDQSVIS